MKQNLIKSAGPLLFLFITGFLTAGESNHNEGAKGSTPEFARQEKTWSDLKSVEDICQAYPQRMKIMLGSFNLDIKGLDQVKIAFNKGDITEACSLLLDYYRNGTTANYLRADLPVPSHRKDPVADSILQNIFTFYRQPDRVPVDADGHLDWKWHGPSDDIEWAWALNRHYHISVLLNAYEKTGNPGYAEAIDKSIKDWIIKSLPYPGVKSSTEMWRGLEVSFRAKIWASVFYNLIKSDLLSPATRLLMLSSLPEHAHYMRNFHAQGNWLTMELSGLATVAAAWPEYKDSPAWLAYAKETMSKSLTEQVYPDGVQTELTSSYHKVALDNFSLFLRTCRQINEPLPPEYNSMLEKMWNYLALTMRPDGFGLLNNDADLVNNREQVLKAASDYHRPDWQYIATNGKTGKKPESGPSVIFPWAGQLIMRSGFDHDAQWAFFDIGPWGTGHQHNDKLHISISAFGRDLLVDAGRFAYKGELADKFRGYATGSYGHNLILVDGKGQAAGPPATKVPLQEDHYKISDAFDYAWNSFDRFINIKGEFNHLRAVFYVRGKFWIVVDHLLTDAHHKIETLWHWHPDCKIIASGNMVSSENERGNLEIIPLGNTKWDISIVKGQEKPEPQGWYSSEYNSAVPSPVAIYSTSITQNSTFVWLLYPSELKAPKVTGVLQSIDNNGVKVKVDNGEKDQWEIYVPYSDSAEAWLNQITRSETKK